MEVEKNIWGEKMQSKAEEKTSTYWVDISRHKDMKLLYISFFNPTKIFSSFNFLIWKMQAILQASSLWLQLKDTWLKNIENVWALFIDICTEQKS